MSKKILLLENDEFYIEVIGTFVRLFLQYDFVAARTPAEASEKVQEDKPDLVLLDLDINGQGALEFAEKLRDDANTKGIPLVAIAQDQAARDKALGSGCEAFVTKPFKIRELEALVTKLLSNA